ncbi:uncharacterized protein BDR25DRAFT_299693, partial [Lindgomyces ingoldianus]
MGGLVDGRLSGWAARKLTIKDKEYLHLLVKPPPAALRGLLILRGYVKVYNVRGIEQETQVTERECRIGG